MPTKEAKMNGVRPFELSTDLGFLYKSDEHERVFKEALAAMERQEGLVCITGEPGTGKTLICERLSTEIDGAYRPILLPVPPKDGIGPVIAGNDEIPGKTPVLIIDEAQHMSPALLDEVKFLWNRSRANGGRLHIVLVGQPELAEMLSSNGPLAQRVGANLVLGRMDEGEVLSYLTYRLTKADLAGRIRFTQGAARFIFRKTRGIPRLINRIASLALARTTTREKTQIRAWDVYHAAAGLSLLQSHRSVVSQKQRRVAWGSLGVVAAVFLAVFLYKSHPWPYGSVGASPEMHGVKVGTYVTKEGAEETLRLLQKDGYKVILREQKLADGWVVYGAYLQENFLRDDAQRMAATLQKRYGVEASPVRLP